jgi:LysR family transcriptional regulator, benzoate and cis,cis-muconate-responsive activator of ben and cat genes
MIEIRHLRYFLAVAKARNFTRAAERLNMAQPPLSRQIHQLEEVVGVSLFDRESRPLSLTPAGALFYEQAIQVVQRMDELKTMMQRFVASDRSRFVIGFVPSIMYARLPNVIRGFREAAPEVDVNLIEMMSLEQIEALKEGRIDAGFGRVRFDDPSVTREVLREERLVVALPLGHPLLAGERPAPLAALVSETLIVYPRDPRPSFADQVLSLFRDQGLEPATVQEVRELHLHRSSIGAPPGTRRRRLSRSQRAGDFADHPEPSARGLVSAFDDPPRRHWRGVPELGLASAWGPSSTRQTPNPRPCEVLTDRASCHRA